MVGLIAAALFAFYVVSQYQLDLSSHESETLIPTYFSEGDYIGEVTEQRFGLSPTEAWLDANRNGVRDLGEQGLSDATVYFFKDITVPAGTKLRSSPLEDRAVDLVHQPVVGPDGSFWITDLLSPNAPDGFAVVGNASLDFDATGRPLEKLMAPATLTIARYVSTTDSSGRYPDPLADHSSALPQSGAEESGVEAAGILWRCACDNMQRGRYRATTAPFWPQRGTILDPHRTVRWIVIAMVAGVVASFADRRRALLVVVGATAVVAGLLVAVFRTSVLLYVRHPGWALTVAGVCIGLLVTLSGQIEPRPQPTIDEAPPPVDPEPAATAMTLAASEPGPAVEAT